MVGILAQVDDIFSWAPRGGKLFETGWGMRIQGHGYLNILCRCNIRRSATGQREHGFLLDQHYKGGWRRHAIAHLGNPVAHPSVAEGGAACAVRRVVRVSLYLADGGEDGVLVIKD